MNIETLIWLTPLPPLLAFFIIVFGANRNKRLSYSIAVDASSLSWLASMILFYYAVTKEGLAEEPFQASINWLPIGTGSVQIGVMVDPLTAVTLFFVAWTVLMIFIYSIGYHNFGQPEGEHDQPGLPPHGAKVRGKKAKRATEIHRLSRQARAAIGSSAPVLSLQNGLGNEDT